MKYEDMERMKLHECVKIDDNLKIQSVFSGFNYIYTKRVIIEEETGKYKTEITHIVFVPYKN